MLIRFFFCLGYLACGFSLQAQYDDLLRNENVSWVAEYTTDYFMNPGNEDEDLDTVVLNYLDVIQFLNSNHENGLYGRVNTIQKYLSQQFLTDLNHRWSTFYQDSLLQQKLDKNAVMRSLTKLDTGYSMCNGEMVVRSKEISYLEVIRFRARHLYWYNQKSKSFDSRLLSYAPVVYTFDQEGNWNGGTRTLFWLKAEDPPSGKFKNDQFNYIFQTKMRANSPGLQDFIVLKGAFDFKKYFSEQIKAPYHPLFDNSAYLPLDPAQLKAECFGQDTIVNFDPETYEEQITLEYRDCIGQIEKIRFVQNWYFDERKKRLYSRLTAIAPFAAIRDSEGYLRYYKPLFYQMFR